MQLRPYQQAAHDVVVAHVRKSLQPVVVDAATGSGKSHVIAALAKTMHEVSGGKGILVLAPNKELVEQDVEKYLATGNDASIFCASAGKKCLDHPVVFGSPITVKNSIEKFRDRISVVVLDEAHSLSPTVKGLIEQLKDHNTHLRVVGLTATPYRLGAGYIYREDAHGKSYDEKYAKEPYFAKCVHRVHARELIDEGYLTPPKIGAPPKSYDTSRLILNRMHRYDAADLEAAFEGKERLTAEIMEDVVRNAKDRRGVMVFATTVRHAEECLAGLPPAESALVTGKTPKKERAELLRRFKDHSLKYLVNVQVLTTGFDAPHVDLIAILRPTESVGLLQQIVGRGLRVCDGKSNCLILDYAGNLAKHCPDGDIFNPRIKAHESEPGEPVDVLCPECDNENTFPQNEFAKQYTLDEYGRCTDLRGRIVKGLDGHPLPGHHGRRCQHRDMRDERCDYRYAWKDCPKCGGKSDTSARYCEHCGNELIDPNRKLTAQSERMEDPYAERTDPVLTYKKEDRLSKKGKPLVVVDFIVQGRKPIRVFLHPQSKYRPAVIAYLMFRSAEKRGAIHSITYRKDTDGYWRLLGINA